VSSRGTRTSDAQRRATRLAGLGAASRHRGRKRPRFEIRKQRHKHVEQAQDRRQHRPFEPLLLRRLRSRRRTHLA